MTVALEGAADLTLVCAIFLLIGLLVVVKGGAQAVASILDIGIAGVHPFRGIANRIENTVVAFLSREINSLQRHAVGLLSGLVDSFGLLIAVPLLLALGVKAALTYLWNHALDPRIESRVKTIRSDVSEAITKAKDLRGDFNTLRDGIKDRIGDASQAVLNTARAYTRQEIADLRKGIGDDIGAIRSSINDAVERAENAGRAAAEGAVGELRNAENAAVEALGRAETLTQEELRDLLARIDAGDIAALLAAVPLLATLVRTLEAETGLDNAECRSKVKGICGTDPGAWDWLLGAAVTLAIPLSLAEIIAAGREVIHYVNAGAQDIADLG